MTNYEELSRKELQALAKEHGIKANLSTAAIIEALRSKLAESTESAEAPVDVIVEDKIADSEVPEKVDTIAEESAQIKRESLSFKFIPVNERNVAVATPTPSPISIPAEPKTFEIGLKVEVLLFGVWVCGTIKKLNKKTVRVVLLGEGGEVSVKLDEMRHIDAAPVTDSTGNVVVEEIKAPEAVEIAPVVEQIEEAVVESSEDSNKEMDAQPINDIEGEKETHDEVESSEEKEDSTSHLLESFEPAEEYARLSLPLPASPARTAAPSPHPTVRFRLSLPANPTPSKKPAYVNPNPFSTTLQATSSTVAKQPTPRKSFAHSPHKAVSAATPTIKPKMNATQKLRLEALNQKRAQEAAMVKKMSRQSNIGNIRKTPTVPTPTIAKTPSAPTPNPVALPTPIVPLTNALQPTPHVPSAAIPPVAEISRVRFDAPSPMRQSNLHARKSTPNFKQMHNKQFASSKSITALVKRDSMVVKKMDDAFQSAMDASDTKQASTLAEHKENRLMGNVTQRHKSVHSGLAKASTVEKVAGAQRKQSLSDKLATNKDIQRAKRSEDIKGKRAMSFAGKRASAIGERSKSEANMECY
eukprot:gene37834-45962_t